MQLILVARRHGATEYGILSRLADENHAHRNGKLTTEQFILDAEIVQIRWLATCPHLFDDVRVQTSFGPDGTPGVTVYPSAETRYLSKAQMSRKAQKFRDKKKLATG